MEHLLFGYLILLVLIMLWQIFKPLPKNINYESKKYIVNEDDVEFLYDLTANGNINQQIFDEIFRLIDEAKKYILIDMFLFNSFNLEKNKVHRKLHDRISKKLIDKIKEYPDIKIDIVTDSINTVYGGVENKEFTKFKKNGINVIITDLKKLRDSNPIYSAIWRSLFQWFGNSNKTGFFPHPFASSEQGVSLRTYLYLLNFKANHRKVIVTDSNENMISIITSVNFHNASSAHSNIAVKIRGDFWREAYITEKSVAEFSGGRLASLSVKRKRMQKINHTKKIEVTLLTEGKIKKYLDGLIKKTGKGDTICIGIFYLSSRIVIKNLIQSVKRGVKIKIILDPNKDAFGYRKNGIPNRQVANELVKKTEGRIEIRWYNTTGEQFHSKFILINKHNEKAECILGSANFTRRNLENYNLETDVLIVGDRELKYFQDMNSYFDKIWNNKDGQEYTLDYNIYKEDSKLKECIYRMQEFIGLAGF